MAAHFGFLEVVKILVEHGANVEAKSREGKTPLLMATERGFLFVVKFLIDRGANLFEKNVRHEQGKIQPVLVEEKFFFSIAAKRVKSY